MHENRGRIQPHLTELQMDKIIDELIAKCDELAGDAHFVQQEASAPEIGERVRLFS
jgi:hypothetical protein